MASNLRQRYPDNYHPRGKDAQLLNIQNGGWNQRRTHAIDPNPPAQVETTNRQPQAPMPFVHPQTQPTQFTPLPLNNQPFLPHSIRIPTTYTRPSALLQTPWPKGNAYHQRYVLPPAAPHHFPAVYNQAYHSASSFPAPVLPVHAVPQQYPSSTYAQVANAPYFHAPARAPVNS